MSEKKVLLCHYIIVTFQASSSKLTFTLPVVIKGGITIEISEYCTAPSMSKSSNLRYVDYSRFRNSNSKQKFDDHFFKGKIMTLGSIHFSSFNPKILFNIKRNGFHEKLEKIFLNTTMLVFFYYHNFVCMVS